MDLQNVGLRNYILSFYRGNSVDSTISSKEFYSNFYVSQINDNTLAQDIKNELFTYLDNPDTSYILLKGQAGSGKSIFIDALFNEDSKDNILTSLPNTHVCILDWAQLLTCQFHDLKQKIRKSYIRISGFSSEQRNKICSKIKNFIQTESPVYQNLHNALKILFVNPYQDTLHNWKREKDINDVVDKALNMQFRLDTSNAAKEMSNSLDNNFLLLVALLILLLKYEHPDENIIIIHDNVEAVNEQILNIVQSLINELPYIIAEINNSLHQWNRVQHVFVCRITNSAILEIHQLTRNNYEEIELCNFDFEAKALLLKKEYLNTHDHNPVLSKRLDILIKLLLDEKNERDTKNYITKNFFPLLNYSFRNIINHTISAIERYSDLLTELLMDDSRYENECINGARAILLYRTFRDLKSKAFRSMGIDELDGTQNHSYVRILLNYLYWYSFNNKNQSIKLRQVYNDLKYYFDNKITFTNTVMQLSVFNEVAADRFSNLIEFTNLRFINNLNKEDLSESELLIQITESGKLFVEYYSINFEFFNARLSNWYGPLFSINDTTTLDKLLDEVQSAIKNFVLAMLNKGKNVCIDYNPDSNKHFCNIESNPFRCSLFTRTRQIVWCITNNIDYVDRYRLYCSNKFQNNIKLGRAINLSCLNFIKKMANLYSTINKELFSAKTNFTEMYYKWKGKSNKPSEYKLSNNCHYWDNIDSEEFLKKICAEIGKIKNIKTNEDWSNYSNNISSIYNLIY